MFLKDYPCGKEVFVAPHLVGFTGDHPSNVDYYYSERGYNCTTEEEVADQYHRNFCQGCDTDPMAPDYLARLVDKWMQTKMERLADPMAPDYGALAAEELNSQIEDSRDSAEVVGAQ